MPMPDARCPMPDARCPMPDARYPIPYEHLMLLRKAIIQFSAVDEAIPTAKLTGSQA